ncbi:MAG: class I SAM-dependent methyltransferase [Acidobacteria bacterium]|nr:class I SAM-dependent methyltransferase [Acidobacteriota bacterium]
MSGRVVDYDSVADGFDRRYALHTYSGVRETLLDFVGSEKPAAILEVGCGTGHWLDAVIGLSPFVAGVEPSFGMLSRARDAVPGARLVRARAETLPWRDASLDRVFCVNALHHFADRERFFAEARRVLRPGGGLLTIGKDPHAERDEWWVYDYFPETLKIDRARFAAVRTLRGELSRAGFAWAESSEADRIEALMPAGEAFAGGMVDRKYTSQLTVLTDEEFKAGVERLRTAGAGRARDGGTLDLITDFRLYATVGWTT